MEQIDSTTGDVLVVKKVTSSDFARIDSERGDIILGTPELQEYAVCIWRAYTSRLDADG